MRYEGHALRVTRSTQPTGFVVDERRERHSDDSESVRDVSVWVSGCELRLTNGGTQVQIVGSRDMDFFGLSCEPDTLIRAIAYLRSRESGIVRPDDEAF
jgi:hypothetical protein